MSIVVGFDFGTHQTKICIGNYSNPHNPIFSFWKFNTPKGETYTLPTIIQINNDDTLSYGYEDESTVKQLNLYSSPEPVRPTLVNPELVYVDGYTRSDGTFVESHFRTAPDGVEENNISYWKG